MLGGLLAVVMTPPFALGYSLAYEPHLMPFWSPLVQALFPLDFASAERVYYTYGRVYFLTLLPELLALYAWRGTRAGRVGKLERWGFRILMVGVWVAVIGVFTDYWVDTPPGILADLLAIPLLVAGLVFLGAGLWRVSAVPRWLSPVMIGAGAGTVPVMLFLFFHVPSGPLLLFHVVLVVLGYILWSGKSVLAEQPSRVS